MGENQERTASDIPDTIRESLTEIIDYLWADELKHARDSASNEPETHRGQHILAHLVKVRAWLEPGYVPDQLQSPVTTLAQYVLQEMGRFGLTEDVRAAAAQLLKRPASTPCLRLVVDYLEDSIDEAEYWGPPEEIWDALEVVRDWLNAEVNV